MSWGRPAAGGMIALIFAAVTVAALSLPGPEPTVHNGLFELGPGLAADILGDPGIPGPDWADIFGANGEVVDMNGGDAAAFSADELAVGGSTDHTTYASSNKNNDLIEDWHWDTGNVPAKDDLSNVYAWAKIFGGHLIVYAGFERIDSSGDSHVDIEFFQDDLSLDEPIPCNDPGPDDTPCSFLGHRTVGDVVVSMDFTKGGDFGTLTIHKWDGSDYVVIGDLNGEGCNGTDTICGFNNGGDIDGGPWANYDRHGKEIQDLPKNAFTEFGIDLTAVSGGTPCLSTVMGKTRSSQSFTAELKDFTGPVSFPLCSLKWHKVDHLGAPLGGATFEVCVTHSYNPETGLFEDIPDECDTVVDNVDGSVDPGDRDEDGAPGEFEIVNLKLGRYTIRETVSPPGYGVDPDTVVIDFTGGNLHLEILEPFVDERPIVKLTEFGYTNAAVGTPTAGVVTGQTVFTVRFRNYGGADAIVSRVLSLTVTGEGGGTYTCSPSCTVSFSQTVAAGAETSFTLTINYTDFADGAQVQADLTATYTTPPDLTVVRGVSGAPASIAFTIQSD